MKRYLFITLLFALIQNSMIGQTFRFDMLDYHRDNILMEVTINLAKGRIFIKEDRQTMMSYQFFSTQLISDGSVLYFAFKEHADPVTTISDDQQYFIVISQKDKQILSFNDIKTKRHFALQPQQETKFSEEFKRLTYVLNGTDAVETASIYQQSADNGDPYAEYKLGQCYEAGLGGMTKNSSKAFNLYSKSANKNYALGQKKLGDCYENGIGVSKSQTEALKWYLKSSEWGIAYSQYHAGLLLHQANNDREAFNWFRKAANQDFDPAITAVAQCYQNGIGTSIDGAKACEYLVKSANHGNVSSMHLLAIIYYQGNIVKKNTSKALELFKSAAYMNYAPSQTQLGLCYLAGNLVVKDENEAYRWIRKAALQDDTDGQKYLGLCFMKGYGVKKDKKQARVWLQKAAAKGDREARQLLDKL